MAKKKKKKEEGGGAPDWMVTYSDMVTLLLTFFVLLLSMASLDQVKFSQAAGSLRGAFGVFGGKDRQEMSPPTVIEFSPIQDDLVQRLYNRILTKFNRIKLDPRIKVVKNRGAVVLRVQDSILFASGSSEVKEEAKPTLKKIAQLVKPLPFQLRIEGHTDDAPIAGEDTTNWDLSVDRSTSVLKYFMRQDLFPLDRMSAVGYGAQKPLVPNTSPENRAKNRRVDFVLESVGSYREKLPYLIDASEQAPY